MLLLKPWENAPVIGQEMGIMLLLKDQFPRLYKISSSPCALFQIWEIGCIHGSWSWNVFWHRNLRAFEWEQFLVWNIEKDGKFLFKPCSTLMNRFIEMNV
jgi:hypothetical protein